MNKIILMGYSGSQCIVPASKYLTSKYLKDFKITYLNYTGEINGWSNYLVNYLSGLSDEYIIFALDDYLVADFIDMEKYYAALTELSEEVVCIKLCQSTLAEHEEYPVTTQYTVWNRNYLIELLGQIKTPWEFELQGSKIFNKKCLLRTCMNYFANSSISGRWDGIRFDGLKEEDIKYIKENLMNEKKITIFGGSGFLGTHLVERFVNNGYGNITVVARNEGELTKLKEKFSTITTMTGDISDSWVVRKAMKDADEVFLLAAIKHVGLAEHEVKSCVNTNVTGVMNIVNESIITKPKVLLFVSTDKASQPRGVYGSTKKIGERLMAEAEKINPDTKYRVVRYGNVWNSTGSIITKWKPKMEKGEEIILTSADATRFFWTVNEAIDLIFECIEKSADATPYIPTMKGVSMGVVLEACMEVYGKSPVKIIGLQEGENEHETMDGLIFSNQVEQFAKEEFQQKFLGVENKEVVLTKPITVFESRPKITCVLITKEKEYPPLIWERLTLGFFDEILLETESASVYQRYLTAKKAKNEIIYVQDDDCMVNYQNLFKKYNGQITNAIPEPFHAKYEPMGCTLVGWGCYFPKSMLDVFDKYIAKYGEDEHLLREADRIFTYFNKPFNSVFMPHEDLPQGEDRMSSPANLEFHFKSAGEALEKCKTL